MVGRVVAICVYWRWRWRWVHQSAVLSGILLEFLLIMRATFVVSSVGATAVVAFRWGFPWFLTLCSWV